MEPEKAHRTLNTALLVIVMALVTLNTSAPWPGIGGSLIEVTIWGSVLGLIFLGFRIAERNIDEIREYLELA